MLEVSLISVYINPPLSTSDELQQLLVYLVYLNALKISKEAMHCENKNCEILKYVDKKICSIVEYYEHVA